MVDGERIDEGEEGVGVARWDASGMPSWTIKAVTEGGLLSVDRSSMAGEEPL